MTLRVVAGELRGRRLHAPPGRTTRPTSDRVREATFNALESMDAVDGARVLDLFAGTGALGIEAVSRGAAHATFVELDAAVRRVLQRNLDACAIGRDRAAVVAADATRTLPDGPFDVALLDPPYAFDGWSALLTALPAPLAVCETAGPLVPPAGWEVVRQKAYGATVVTVVCRTTSSSHRSDP